MGSSRTAVHTTYLSQYIYIYISISSFDVDVGMTSMIYMRVESINVYAKPSGCLKSAQFQISLKVLKLFSYIKIR